MSKIWGKLHPYMSDYVDGFFDGTPVEYEHRLKRSTTVYVGNLSFFTTEMQVHALFSRAGPVKRVVMGLDRLKNTPCGFCFVEYYSRRDAESCVHFLNGSMLDNRPIRTDFDWGGMLEERRFGRGKNGGQVRDEHRATFDADRGGWGKILESKMKSTQGEDADRSKRPRLQNEMKETDN